PDPSAAIHRTIKLRRPPDIIGTRRGIFADPISGAAVLEYGATEILSPLGAILNLRARSLPTRSPSQRRTAARKAGVLDPQQQLGERDGLSAGGHRIRTIGSAGMPGILVVSALVRQPASKTWSCHAVPMVRIGLPPPASPFPTVPPPRENPAYGAKTGKIGGG